MEGFARDIASLHWWLAVVTVGVIINIVSVYAHRHLDRALSNWSSRYRKHAELRIAKRRDYIEALRQDGQKRTEAAIDEIRNRLRFIQFILFGAVLFLLAVHMRMTAPANTFVSNLALLFGAIAIMSAVPYIFAAFDQERLLNESRRGLSPAEHQK